MLRAIDQYAAKAGRLVAENRLAVASVVSGATVALCPNLVIAPVLRPLGFTPDGIVAGMCPPYPALVSASADRGASNRITGSLAAAAQSRLGETAAGGVFAFCQSAAAGGYGATSLSSTASAAVAAVAKAVVAMHEFRSRDDEYAGSESGSERMAFEREESPMRSPPPQPREVRGQWGPGGHSPVYVEETKTCWLCRLKWPECEDLPTTNWACERCEAPLCLNEERNCYREFHAH